MGTPYAGINSFPASAMLIDDGDDLTAANLNPGIVAALDRTTFLAASDTTIVASVTAEATARAAAVTAEATARAAADTTEAAARVAGDLYLQGVQKLVGQHSDGVSDTDDPTTFTVYHTWTTSSYAASGTLNTVAGIVAGDLVVVRWNICVNLVNTSLNLDVGFLKATYEIGAGNVDIVGAKSVLSAQTNTSNYTMIVLEGRFVATATATHHFGLTGKIWSDSTATMAFAGPYSLVTEIWRSTP